MEFVINPKRIAVTGLICILMSAFTATVVISDELEMEEVDVFELSLEELKNINIYSIKNIKFKNRINF